MRNKRETDISSYTGKGPEQPEMTFKRSESGAKKFFKGLGKFLLTVFSVLLVAGVVTGVSLSIYIIALASEPTGIDLKAKSMNQTSRIFIKDSAGYRAGIHMKAYQDKVPAMVIGGTAGSFLGEYQAGGVIVVLGLDSGSRRIVGNFPCTGMHGGKMFLRGDHRDISFPSQVTARAASQEDMAQIQPLVVEYCQLFGRDPAQVLDAPFTMVTPDSKNPYKQMYVAN